MTNTELIRQEIERLKAELPKQDLYTTVGADSICVAKRYDELLSSIDSLPKEQPEVDLDKEAEGYWVDAGWSKVITLGKFKHIARHFYELGRLNARKEE